MQRKIRLRKKPRSKITNRTISSPLRFLLPTAEVITAKATEPKNDMSMLHSEALTENVM